MSENEDSISSQPIVQISMKGLTIEQAFNAFHSANPHVYELLVHLARRAKARGRKLIGMKMLYEVARWHFYLNARTDDEFMLNNNFTSRYARKIQDENADLDGMFETRRLRTE